MGRTRKFTEELYSALYEYANSTNYDWLWTYISWEIRDAFGDVDLTEESDGYQKYLQGIVEINNYTVDKLHTIFNNVKSLDDNYSKLLSQVNDEVEDYTTIIKRLRESIGDVNFENNFSKMGFLTSVAVEAETMTMIRWREILKKDAGEITQEEYAMLAAYLVKNGDEELLQEMLVACYDYREVAEYQNGGGITTIRVIYESPEKIQQLAAAMANLSEVWTAAQSLGYTGEDQGEAFRAVQYALLLEKLAENKELSMLTQQSIFTDNRTELLSDLIDVTYDEMTDAVSVAVCPYNAELSGSYCDYVIEKRNKMQYTVSYPSIGCIAWTQVQDEAHTYINAYMESENNVGGAMAEETVSQLMGLVIGEIPDPNKVMAVTSAVGSVAGAGVGAYIGSKDTTVQECMALEELGPMLNTFQLVYVGVDTNGEISNHECSVFGSTDTADCIEAFNRYMQSEEGEQAAKLISYKAFPEGKLTYEYLVEHPGEVAGMIKAIETRADISASFERGMAE